MCRRVLPRLRSQPGARIVPKVPAAIARMTYAEYLAFEAQSDARHEYLNGEVFAMAGGTITHGALTMAVGAALSSALRDRRCWCRSANR